MLTEKPCPEIFTYDTPENIDFCLNHCPYPNDECYGCVKNCRRAAEGHYVQRRTYRVKEKATHTPRVQTYPWPKEVKGDTLNAK